VVIEGGNELVFRAMREALRSAAIRLVGRLADQDGATAVEYGLIVAFIAAVVVTAVTTLGGKVLHCFQLVLQGW
jgi:pilus assembly protein Flp/PilA